MKRPLTLAIFAFAGGEALYETAGCGIMAGTVIAVSVFSVLILFRYGRGRAFLPILISFLLGFFSGQTYRHGDWHRRRWYSTCLHRCRTRSRYRPRCHIRCHRTRRYRHTLCCRSRQERIVRCRLRYFLLRPLALLFRYKSSAGTTGYRICYRLPAQTGRKLIRTL